MFLNAIERTPCWKCVIIMEGFENRCPFSHVEESGPVGEGSGDLRGLCAAQHSSSSSSKPRLSVLRLLLFSSLCCIGLPARSLYAVCLRCSLVRSCQCGPVFTYVYAVFENVCRQRGEENGGSSWLCVSSSWFLELDASY